MAIEELMFSVEEWDDAEQIGIIEVLARCAHPTIARAAFEAAKKVRPKSRLLLCNKAMILDRGVPGPTSPDPAVTVPLSDEDRDLVEVVIACTNGQIGRAAAIEIIGELDAAGFEIVRQRKEKAGHGC